MIKTMKTKDKKKLEQICQAMIDLNYIQEAAFDAMYYSPDPEKALKEWIAANLPELALRIAKGDALSAAIEEDPFKEMQRFLDEY